MFALNRNARATTRNIIQRSLIHRRIPQCTAFLTTANQQIGKEKHDRRLKRNQTGVGVTPSRRHANNNNNNDSSTSMERTLTRPVETIDASEIKIEPNSTLSKCNEIMSKLLQRRQELPSPPIDWLNSGPIDDTDFKNREDLYKDVISLTRAIELSIKAKRIQASSGRDIRELTALLGNILLICSESPPKRISSSPLPSTSQFCAKVLSLLNALNLDIQQIHIFCSIRAANQEHEWELASSLFRKQIDPDFNGLVPVDPQLGWNGFLEMGLFGLAMDLSHRGCEGVDVVEGVLDAVRDMCMVSPTDQEKCK